MSKLPIKVETSLLGQVARYRTTSWTQALNDWDARNPAAPLPAWKFDLETMSKHMTPGGTLPYDVLYDASEDGTVNSGDKAFWMGIGVPLTLVAPPPGGYTVEDLIADATGVNDGTCCPPVNSFDWGQHAKGGCSGRAPGGDQFTGWGTAQWLACGASKPGVRYQTRNLKVLGMKADHTWVNLGGGFEWVSCFNPDTTSGAFGATGSPGDWEMPQGQHAIHWATFRRSTPAGLIGTLTYYEAKGDGIMVNAGFDQISGGNIMGDLFISKYKKVYPDRWTPIAGTSITAALLRSFPPPALD